MNLLEAVKSGKKFKRPHHTHYYPTIGTMIHGGSYRFDAEDVIASDWGLEEQKVTISTTEFFHAFSEVIKEAMFHRQYTGDYVEVVNAMAKKLGLT